MRIGVDGVPLATLRTGVGHYTFELARHLSLTSPAHQFELLSQFPFDASLADESLPSNLRMVQVKVKSLHRRWFAAGLPLHLRRGKFDLFHGTNYEVPLWNPCPTVLTIHDLSLFFHPETHEKRLVRRGRLRLPIMARRANRIITPSETVKSEVVEHLKLPAAKIAVVPEAPRDVFQPMHFDETVETRKRLGVEDNFMLFAGTVEPRKNLATLLQAFQEIISSTSHRVQLVVAGKKGWLTDDLLNGFEALQSHVRFTDYVSDPDLRALYSSCRVFVYPSLYEGFGLPPLEAMACGAPVITSEIPSLIETTGSDAALHFPPRDAVALAKSIIGVLENDSERKYLSSSGLQRAKQFSWTKAANATMKIYRDLLSDTL